MTGVYLDGMRRLNSTLAAGKSAGSQCAAALPHADSFPHILMNLLNG
ncbi:MAG: hypothetical protein K2O70_02225 [Desulfovibrionaceae bacterium]|nr:hypothetical protein [Desulfovibrionaceae bacterium]